MHWKFSPNLHRSCQIILGLGCVLSAHIASAHTTDCPFSSKQHLLCTPNTLETRQQLAQLLLNTNITTNAPTRLIQDTQVLWQQRIEQCKTKRCVRQQFNSRSDDLNSYSSLDQNLTQHYIQYKVGSIAQPQVHLQIHQLDQKRIKIEGLAYRSPNNSVAKQTISFLAYQNQDNKNEIINNETGCKYGFNFQKAILTISLLQAKPHQLCDRFVGNYRLYD